MPVTAYIYRDARKDERFPFDGHADAYTSAGHAIEIRVRDISVGGFSFSSPLAFRVGEKLKVDLGGETLLARVVWQVQGSVGCIFERPLTGDQLQGAYVRRNADRKPFRLPLFWRVVVIVGSAAMLWSLLAAVFVQGVRLVRRLLS